MHSTKYADTLPFSVKRVGKKLTQVGFEPVHSFGRTWQTELNHDTTCMDRSIVIAFLDVLTFSLIFQQ
jgi:hypothetical protein